MLMRSLVVALLLAMAFVSTPAFAEEAAEQTLADLVGALEASLDDADATWEKRWAAYRAMIDRRSAVDADTKASDEKVAERAKAELAAGTEAYTRELQQRTAKAVYRDKLPLSGWVMGIFGFLLLYGGFFFCIRVAMKDPVKIDDAAE